MKYQNFLHKVIFVLALVCIVLLFPGCATNGVTVTDHWGSRWFYSCDMPQWWVEHVNENYPVEVHPWKEFNNIAWGAGINPGDTRAFFLGYRLILRERYSLDNYYHEIAHSWEQHNGDYRNHGPTCWQNSKPWEYDKKVIETFSTITLPPREV